MSPSPSTFRIGQHGFVNGHDVTRAGLCGAGAYVVDGVPLDLEAAETVVAVPVEAQSPTRRVPHLGETTCGLCGGDCEGRCAGGNALPRPAPLLATAVEPAPASRTRLHRPPPGPRAVVPKPRPDSPELLVEVHDALGAKRLFKLEHRAFDGGEAVVVRMRNPEHDVERELGTAVVQLMTGGFHAEWGTDRASLVVARNRAVLAPEPPARRGAPARRSR